jgi:Mg-chelatase subunit ChlD
MNHHNYKFIRGNFIMRYEGLSSALKRSARVLTSAIVASVFAFSLLIATPRQQANAVYQVAENPCIKTRPTKLIFLIDRSGSMAPRGQTYNSQIEGVIRSLRDPTVVPRDGSIEVGIVVFAESATTLLVNERPLTQINSFTDAEAVATRVNTLKCANLASQIAPCPFGATSLVAAIQLADSIASQNGNPQAHRLLVMSTDGQTSDADADSAACRIIQARNAARLQGLTFEFDLLLIGLDPASPEFAVNKARVDKLVAAQDGQQTNCPGSSGGGGTGGGQGGGNGQSTSPDAGEQNLEPQTVDTLPGATLVINGGECSVTGAAADCERQVNDFANDVRRILRGNVAPVNLVVNTEADTSAGAPVSGNTLSLRQAIEAANCNGGDATITFAASLDGKTIRPLIPLPALTQPNIKIDGCTGDNCAPIVTIDGTITDSDVEGGHLDGLLIRSYDNIVRGLRIVNFERAGVAIDPIQPSDVTLNNLVEKNVFEDNTDSGVLVGDPSAETARAILHSTGNTISQNTVTDSVLPIDLGGNGLTANDTNDADQGPNTLLNFPDSINVAAAANNTVNVTGQLNGPTVAGAIVEVFAVTKFRNVDSSLVIDGIGFLGQTTADANGAFAANGLPVSPTGIYTATVTDSAGNTSEVLTESATIKPGRAIAAATTPINFGDVTVNAASTPRPVLITNTGNAPLVVTGCTLVRCSANDPDHTARFTITGCPTTPINPGEQATINVVLTPNACGAVKACLALATNDPARPTLTSELNGNGNAVGQGLLTLQGGGSILDFGTVGARGKGLKLKKQPARTFTILNQGCQTLSLTIPSIVRTGASVTSGKITQTNDSAFFNVVAVSANGTETAITNPVALAPQQSNTFKIRFNPKIPAVSDKTTGLAASEVLPDTVTSQLVIAQAGGSPLTVNLIGRVATDVRFINATNPAATPIIDFTRAGDEFTVVFSIFDSNLNVSKASYEFIDRSGRSVGQIIVVDMTQQVQDRGLVTGQSFRVTQKFTGAKDNPNISLVRVSVSDNETIDTLSGDLLTVSTLQAQSLQAQFNTLLMPTIRLAPRFSPRGERRENK